MAQVIDMRRYGASPSEWAHFDMVLGLTEDLLPVVSNPSAEISPLSKMQALGKTPSQYNTEGLVAGFPKWTEQRTTAKQIARWQTERDYGICVQTRRVRALDIDVDDHDLGSEIAWCIAAHLDIERTPVRSRRNSAKRLFAFEVDGLIGKRVIRTSNGIIEFLATGQQFIAVGTHPSGVPYEWDGGLPTGFPFLTLEKFDALWQELELKFAVVPSTTTNATTRHAQLANAVHADPCAQHLYGQDLVISEGRDGALHIVCPFHMEHTGPSTESATTYFPAHTGGYERGHFKCLHAHCADRSDDDYRTAIGYVETEFEDLTAEAEAIEAPATPEKPLKFPVLDIASFTDHAPAAWHIKGVIPKAGLVVLYGPSGSGKSFLALDLCAAIARGLPDWRGHRVRHGRVIYVIAEGVGGFRNRIRAYNEHNGIAQMDELGIIANTPNLMQNDHVELARAIEAWGGADMIVIDTFAQVTPGANENSAEDVGAVLNRCARLHKHTGATILLVHHTGKDVERGARGWSGLRAACDAEIEVVRQEEHRAATITKMKDGEDGRSYGFQLNTVTLGNDDDGDEISSCTVHYTDEAAATIKGMRKKSPWQIAVERALSNIAALDSGKAAVNSVIEAAADSMPNDDASGRDRRKDNARRALEVLVARGDIQIEKGMVWAA